MFTVVQVGMRHSIFHGHKTFSLWVPRLGPKLPVWTGDAPLPPLASTPQIFGEPLPDPDFLLLCSPVVGQYLHSRVFSLAGSSYMGKDRDNSLRAINYTNIHQHSSVRAGLDDNAWARISSRRHREIPSLLQPISPRQSMCQCQSPLHVVCSSHPVSQAAPTTAPWECHIRASPARHCAHTVQCQHRALCYSSPAAKDLFKGTEAALIWFLTCWFLTCQLQLPKDRNGVVESISYTDTLPPPAKQHLK